MNVVLKTVEFCIENDEFCITNDELLPAFNGASCQKAATNAPVLADYVSKHDEFCIKYEEFLH